MKKAYTVERTQNSNSVLTVRMKDIHAGWEQWFLMTTDRHWDNPRSDLAMQKRHLNEAKERGAGVMDAGDLFCAMQGRDDKRGGKSSIRSEHSTDCYFDNLVNTASDWFSPWADQFIFASPGNHESAVLKRHETNLTERFVARLRDKYKSEVVRVTYCGWVRFMFIFQKTTCQSVRLFYHHGWGGGGPVTRGVIDTNRMAVYTDAELIWTGHTHDQWALPIIRDRLSNAGVPYLSESIHFRTPGYKDEYSAREGYHIEKGRGPKPIGAAWLRFFLQDGKIRYDVTRAL